MLRLPDESPKLTGLAPWRPQLLAGLRPDLGGLVAGGELAYVVVDELDAGVAGLVISEWPRVDELGRLRFELEADVRVAVDAAALQELLGERVPVASSGGEAVAGELRRRRLVVGDVFAAPLRERPAEDVETPGDPRRWLGSPIVDLSSEAREAAKVQYYAAVAHVLDERELDEIVSEFRGEGPPGTEPEGGPGEAGA